MGVLHSIPSGKEFPGKAEAGAGAGAGTEVPGLGQCVGAELEKDSAGHGDIQLQW